MNVFTDKHGKDNDDGNDDFYLSDRTLVKTKGRTVGECRNH